MMSLRWPGRLKQGDYPKANITNIYKYVYVQIFKGHLRQGDYSDSMRKHITCVSTFVEIHQSLQCKIFQYTFLRQYPMKFQDFF